MHSFAAGLLLVYKLCFCVMFTLNWACAKSVLGMCRHNWPCLWQIWWMTMTIWYVFGWLKLRLNSGFVLKLRHRLDAVTHFLKGLFKRRRLYANTHYQCIGNTPQKVRLLNCLNSPSSTSQLKSNYFFFIFKSFFFTLRWNSSVCL